MREQRQLMLNESAERLRDKFDLPLQALICLTDAVEANAEPLVQLVGGPPLEPRPQRVRQNGGLGRARLLRHRPYLLGQVVRKVELVPLIECLHRPRN
jgi:hypothetical protein